ncbi:MAG: DNA repair protein RecN [Clostridium sp.]
MLFHLRVKNLALIDSAEVEFKEGLNILTGETGAGKSVIIGSVNVALGAKSSKNLIRQGCDNAYVELVFSVTDEKKCEVLKELDVCPDEDGMIIISKKITPTRSISKINDETVTSQRLREITGILIDIHGQHEHQSLLYPAKHLEILDEYGKSQITELKHKTAESFKAYTELKHKMESFQSDRDQRTREADFYRFEIDEIEAAELVVDEEEKWEMQYRRFNNSKKIAESLSEAYEAAGGESDAVGRALKSVESVAEYDETLGGIRDQLFDVDALLSDLTREISSYMDDMSFDEETFKKVEARLDLIHGLEDKYGRTVDAILAKLEEKRAKLEELENYDLLRVRTEKQLKEAEEELKTWSAKLSDVRQKTSKELAEKIREGLEDLNFLDVKFTMEFQKMSHYTANGYDEAEFMISTNPGEPVRALGTVASGGELSRIMLAIKTVLADTDDIPTLIFDEIDAGISGRTAQMVSEKLRVIAKNHQVICITHLPQIAAMADCHFEISKSASGGRTTTAIRELNREQMVDELARLLGGAKITETVRKSASEMKDLAERT